MPTVLLSMLLPILNLVSVQGIRRLLLLGTGRQSALNP